MINMEKIELELNDEARGLKGGEKVFQYTERKISKLYSENANALTLDNIACYVLIGGNPGGTEGNVYIFQLEENELKVLKGNVFDDYSLKKCLVGILPQFEKFYDSCNFEKHKDGWVMFPFAIGHYVFIRDFMEDDIFNNWKSVDARSHLDRLVKGVVLTVRKHEDKMRSITSSALAKKYEVENKMDDDQKKTVE